MRTYTPDQIKSYVASEDGDAFLLVSLAAADRSIAVNKTATGFNAGVLTEVGMKSGQGSDVVISGTTLARAGAAITKGASLQADNQGRVIARTGSNYIVGYAEEAASAADDVIEIRVK